MNLSTIRLSDFFKGIVLKKLTPTETDPAVSNGHEYQGIKAFLEVFGKPENGEKIYMDFTYLYVSDNELGVEEAAGQLSCYDCRWNQEKRAAEYRLYYKDNVVTEKTKAGDYLILAEKKDGSLWAIVIERDSQALSDILLSFNINSESNLQKFAEISQETLRKRDISPLVASLLHALGIPHPNDNEILGEMLEKFGEHFPATGVFSAYARSVSNYPDANAASADEVIVDWYNTEEYLFHTFENYLINKRLNESLSPESFLEYAKSVLNRRKARAGQGLENHLESLFLARNVRFSRTPLTEGKSRPDFLFPSIEAYQDMNSPEDLLHMLGVKTTCKDRWRQILVEADRIQKKHLLTMQPAISSSQTDEMIKHGVQLVVPLSIHDSYSAKQRLWLMDVEDFIAEVRTSQTLLRIS